MGAAEKAEVKAGLTTLAPGYAGAQLSAAAELEKAQKVQQKPIPKKEKHTSNNRGAGGKHHIQQPARRGQN